MVVGSKGMDSACEAAAVSSDCNQGVKGVSLSAKCLRVKIVLRTSPLLQLNIALIVLKLMQFNIHVTMLKLKLLKIHTHLS